MRTVRGGGRAMLRGNVGSSCEFGTEVGGIAARGFAVSG